MNRIVQKMKATRATKTAIPKKRRKESSKDNKAKAKVNDKEQNDAPKLTAKERFKKFFIFRHNKKVNPKSMIAQNTQETQSGPMNDVISDELEKLKSSLKEANVREQASKWVNLMLEKGISGLEMELDNINKSTEKVKTTAFDANEDRNLSKEVICQDDHRVLLKDEANDYIHANYVSTPSLDKHFICTQRPMETTIESFYKMILQEQVQYIVMLCSFTETTEKKCPEYFPQSVNNDPMKFGSITVKCCDVYEPKKEPDVVFTTLEIKDGDGKQLTVRHYNWKSWPERGFPDPKTTIFYLICAVRDASHPVVVHCSDGVGRSGVFVAIECMLQKLLRGENCEDAIDLVKEIRNHRAMAIKTVSQYILLHRLLLQFFQELNIADMSQRLLEFIDDYDAFTRKHKDDE